MENEHPPYDLTAATPPPIREVTRLITYRGHADDVARQLGKSLPDGTREGSPPVTITVRTLDDTANLLIGTADPLAALLQRLHEVDQERIGARLQQRDTEHENIELRAKLTAARQEAENARASLLHYRSMYPASDQPAPAPGNGYGPTR